MASQSCETHWLVFCQLMVTVIGTVVSTQNYSYPISTTTWYCYCWVSNDTD